MNDLNKKLNLILLSLLGIGVLLVGVIFACYQYDYIVLLAVLIGIVICTLAYMFRNVGNRYKDQPGKNQSDSDEDNK